jgi:MFS family permease
MRCRFEPVCETPSRTRARDAQRPSHPRREGDDSQDLRPQLTVWWAWLVLMAGANVATPLYLVYAVQFHFSSLVLTSIFATYAVVLVPALILFGRLSDSFGRRPVILAGVGVACGGLLLFALASNAARLYGARALQGLAVGMISGPRPPR